MLRDTLRGHTARHGVDATVDLMIAETDALNAEIATLRARAEKAEAALAAIEVWTHTYGSALSPPGHDTYGEGMRDAKSEVAAILRGTVER